MTTLSIVKVAIPMRIYKVFDYLLPIDYAKTFSVPLKGVRVQVPFRGRESMGFVVGIDNKTEIPLHHLKTITAILDDTPLLPPVLMQLVEWMSEYYHHPFGEVMEAALPTRLRKLKTLSRKDYSSISQIYTIQSESLDKQKLTLNTEQQYAVNTVQAYFNQFSVFLLEGVTGSGKTEVYLRLIQEAIIKNQQVLLLVPEIGLTPQMVGRLQQRLGEKIVWFHSRLTELQRLVSWQMMKSGKKWVMVGTRSAIFTPFKSLGLIIIDEEHDYSFKQLGHLSYHARDVAIMRARFENIPIVLGSATPSLESIWNVLRKGYQRLTLSQRAGGVQLPNIELLDLRQQKMEAGLSKRLLSQIEKHLANGNQVLLFLNRRGFSPVYLCHGCGWVMTCSACDSPLRFHTHPKRLRCHYCQEVLSVSLKCPQCHQDQLFALGQGTQRLEKVLGSYFPKIPITRIDADTTQQKDALHRLLEAIHPNEPAILIGTQILAKGHHLPGISLAVVVDGDAGLFGADFRSLEQSAQLIMQVGGRAGRSHQVGQVIVQTHHPYHRLLRQLVEKGYAGFTQLALEERKEAGWPPFSYLALLRVAARSQSMGLDFLKQVKSCCMIHQMVSLLGPIPSLAAKRAGYYYTHLLFQSARRSDLHQVLNHLMSHLDTMTKKGIRYSLEVDPLEVC